ncbi:FecCD family ABC transporter permease [Paenibacillus terreus]|uniref:FecCD family ABC transporter permease n=1 Tax=Paenibacillus terreus TaxID=1387834 RepID=A0ABV5B8P8_9BACL
MNNNQSGHRRLPFVWKLVGGMLLLILCFIASMKLGAEATSFRNVWLALTGGAQNDQTLILRELRLPRELAAMLIGAALSVSGAVMQGITRNPLADPGLLGLTSGANMMLALAFVFIPSLSVLGIMTACFVGAALGAALVIGLGSVRGGRLSPLRIVLAGAAASAFMYAISEGISIMFKISKDVSMWTAGGFIGTNWVQLQTIAPFIAVGLVAVPLLSSHLNILGLGEEVAAGLGQRLVWMKAILYVLVIMLTGASVALVGNLAFVGLMVPHMVRTFVGTDYRHIIPMSIVLGASFMLLAETLGRTINAPYETPVVAITAMLGLPFFLFVVHKGGRSFS